MMRSTFSTIGSVVLAIALVCPSSMPQAAGTTRPKTVHGKTVWNYDGGIDLVTDGSIPGGPCFRLNGRVTAPEFFAGLKRIDFENAETVFRRGEEDVKEYPDEVLLEFYFHDHLCPEAYEPGGNNVPHAYLTREIVSKLRLNLYWKRGIDLRPVESVTRKYFDVKALRPYAVEATDLPERLEWSYVFLVHSAGVPLTDSLVLILRTEDDRIAARVAARM
jgi:hypothetical protein